jgi:hypothetical protein
MCRDSREISDSNFLRQFERRSIPEFDQITCLLNVSSVRIYTSKYLFKRANLYFIKTLEKYAKIDQPA